MTTVFLRFPSLTLVAALWASGCATKMIISEWTNPAYSPPASSFKRIVVIGASDRTSIRRNFEDRLTGALQAIGVNAVPSYRYIPEDGKVAESRLKEAIRSADADAVIITRLSRVEERTEVCPVAVEVGLGLRRLGGVVGQLRQGVVDEEADVLAP